MFPKRWLVCFDILGATELNERASRLSNPFIVLEVYEEALKISKQLAGSSNVSQLYFSDTLIFYSLDDKASSYSWIHAVATNFICICLYKRIPLRGAITYDEFYADQNTGAYFGRAFTDAYQKAEKQNWIGLIMLKTAIDKIRENGIKSQSDFIDVPIPTKENNALQGCLSYTFAKMNDNVISILDGMKKAAKDEAKVKYENTVKHIKSVREVAKIHVN